MPGRGQPWKGVGKGVKDRIGTEAIADGSITEADLDTSLQSKVNSGGHEVLDEGSSLPQRARLDFVGAGVEASDGVEDTTTVTIAGGGGFDPVTTFRYFDDFMYNGTDSILESWDEFGTNNGSIDAPGFDTNSKGTMGWQTSGVSGERQGIITTSGELFTGGDSYTLKWNFKLDNATDTLATMGGTNGQTVNGTTANAVESFSDGAWFSLDSATSTNWICKTRDNGGEVQTTNSGVAGNSSFNDFEIVVTRGSNVVFKINGTTVATHSTEVPDDGNDMMISINNKTANSQDIEIDYILIEAPR